jgi:hypothetical protein
MIKLREDQGGCGERRTAERPLAGTAGPMPAWRSMTGKAETAGVKDRAHRSWRKAIVQLAANASRAAGIVVAWPVRSEIVPAAADRVTGHPEQREYHARYQDDDADRPDDGNPGDEPDNEENDSEDNQEGS